MPIYEYRCAACGHELEALQKLSDAPMTVCPSCQKPELRKLVSAAGFQLKGSGWYVTDFRNSGAKPAAKEKPAAKGKPGAKAAKKDDVAEKDKPAEKEKESTGKDNTAKEKDNTAEAAPKPAAPTSVELKEAQASFSQKDFAVAGAIDDRKETAWAISPLVGRPQTATFFPKDAIENANGSSLVVTLEFGSPKLNGYSLGRFRIWVLGWGDAATATNIPPEIQEIIKVSEANRTEPQKAEITAFYRSIAPSLEPTRQRLAELKRALPSVPLVIARNKSSVVPIPIRRSAEFNGPVTLTLEGFSAGRDPKDRQPTPISKNFDITPLTADSATALAKLNVKTKGNCELGTRMVVIKAEAKVGNDTYVEYSPAFPITVIEK
jgi:putative FmdB family regulatory protein